MTYCTTLSELVMWFLWHTNSKKGFPWHICNKQTSCLFALFCDSITSLGKYVTLEQLVIVQEHWESTSTRKVVAGITLKFCRVEANRESIGISLRWETSFTFHPAESIRDPYFLTIIPASHNLQVSLSRLRRRVQRCLHTAVLQEIASSDVASVCVTRWRAFRMGSDLPLPATTSLPRTKPQPDLIICCKIKAKLSQTRVISLVWASQMCK